MITKLKWNVRTEASEQIEQNKIIIIITYPKHSFPLYKKCKKKTKIRW